MDMPIETGVLGFFPTLKFDYQTHITCSFFCIAVCSRNYVSNVKLLYLVFIEVSSISK